MYSVTNLVDEINGDDSWSECPLCIGGPLGKIIPVASVSFVVNAEGRRVVVLSDRDTPSAACDE